MITQERALETLERYNIDEVQLSEWETELGLEVPVDSFGNKLYSPVHINLFKNVKKHLALGRSLSEIRRMVILPPAKEAQAAPAVSSNNVVGPSETVDMLFGERQAAEVQNQHIQEVFENTLSHRLLRELRPVTPRNIDASSALTVEKNFNNPTEEQPASLLPQRVTRGLKRFASGPVRITTSSMVDQQNPNAGLLVLIDRLVEEKDNLQANLLQMEKQKLHLYQVNEMFQRRVKELSDEIQRLEEKLKARENLKLIDDKSRLQKQVIEAEQRQTVAEKQLMKLNTEVHHLRDSLASKIDPKAYIGNWLEEAELVGVDFDNFGINIESKRNRMFRVTQSPERFFGHTAIIETTYDYQTNALWKRTETLILNIITENRLEGEMIADYILDGTPVAKATYRIKCHRNGVKTD